MIHPLVAPSDLRQALIPEAVAALEEMRDVVTTTPAHLDRLFPAAARRTTRGELADGVLVEDAVRVELLVAAAQVLEPDALLAELRALYRFGDSDEKRAVLHALNSADDTLDGSDLVRDALRTNDTRLVAVAMGDHALARLSDEEWRHGVLKCLFSGVPVAHVAGLRSRADAELAAMAGRFAHERRAAGRDVPSDLTTVIDACPTPQET